MKIGVTIPNHFGVADAREVIRLGRLAEELGYDSVWVMDHLFNLGYIRDRLEHKPYYHPLATLSYLAAVTQRVTLGTSVMVLPYHDAVDLAKYAATLDQLSGGRLILGVGAGGIKEEFDNLGVAMNRRGSITSEAMAALKELWTSPLPRFEGRRWRFSNAPFAPKPLQKPHIPLWVGGASPGAMKRAALLGDGWHPIGVAPEQYAPLARQVREMASAAGRDGEALTMSVRIDVLAEPRPTRPGTESRTRLGEDKAHALDVLKGYEAAGVAHVCLALESGNVPKLEARMRQYATDVLPAFRA